ncbi:MAG TPA: tetratricopeptide repeat protein [candidate division Zixibacteria bacterium]|nr:tetratricopeptide repeat protein [candidate division Zixibacteria bacterium]
MTDSICAACGKPLTAGDRFCAACGAPTDLDVKPVRGGKPASKKPPAGAPRSASTGMRDGAIIVGALALITVGWFVFRTPAVPPQPPSAATPAGHPEVPGAPMGGMTGGLSDLPADYDGLVQAGNRYMDAGNYAVAAQSYRRALALDPSSPDVRTDFGACLHGMGLPERAIEEFREVMQTHPEHGIANFNIGIVYLDMGKPDSARFYWEKYLQLEPTGAAAAKARELLGNLNG